MSLHDNSKQESTGVKVGVQVSTWLWELSNGERGATGRESCGTLAGTL